MNVESVWATQKGSGARIAVVDDGLEIGHEDLAPNVVDGMSHNYIGGTDPTGGDHGTSVGGVAAAKGSNTIGMRGAAPDAELVGYNLLQVYTDANQADAMSRDRELNHINTNSWGPSDNGKYSDSPAVWKAAITDGLTNGAGRLHLCRRQRFAKQ